jgi:hypothetical protein
MGKDFPYTSDIEAKVSETEPVPTMDLDGWSSVF